MRATPNPPRAVRGPWPLAPALLLACALLAACGGAPAAAPTAEAGPASAAAPTPPPRLTESPFTGYLAPTFSIPDLAGRPVSLASLRGHPVWINLWATWCEPCRVEMPAMQALYERYKGRGLIILGVNEREDRAAVEAYVRAGGYGWQFLLDSDGAVARRYQMAGLPSHIFVDSAGAIRRLDLGGLEPARMGAALATILPP
jgi:thiol-disulfide isomerase/thioredoxin